VVHVGFIQKAPLSQTFLNMIIWLSQQRYRHKQVALNISKKNASTILYLHIIFKTKL